MSAPPHYMVPAQISLIRATLGEPVAMREFRSQTPDWSRIPYPWTRLFPLLAARPGLTWRAAENNLLLQHCTQTSRENTLLRPLAQAILEQFEVAGIAVIVLKGLAAGQMYYADFNLRPMGDFDLLVRPADLKRAGALLKRAGWSGQVDPERDLGSVHAASFAHPQGVHLDLHWAALNGCLWAGADEAFWEQSLPFSRARVLSPAHNLIHLCVHGYTSGWSGIWVCDCCLLLHQQAPDWDEVLAEAQRRQLSPLLLQALSWLRETFQAPIPASVISRLRAVPSSPLTHLYCWSRTHPQHPVAFVGMPWLEFRRNRPPQQTFREYLRKRWQLQPGESLGQSVCQRMLAWAQRRQASQPAPAQPASVAPVEARLSREQKIAAWIRSVQAERKPPPER